MTCAVLRCARAEDFLLEDLANYSYLSYGNVSVPQVDDADMFKQTNEAFRIMGITPEEVTGTRVRLRLEYTVHILVCMRSTLSKLYNTVCACLTCSGAASGVRRAALRQREDQSGQEQRPGDPR